VSYIVSLIFVYFTVVVDVVLKRWFAFLIYR